MLRCYKVALIWFLRVFKHYEFGLKVTFSFATCYNAELMIRSECETIIELLWNQKCLCSIFVDWVLSSNTYLCVSTRVNNITYLVKVESFSINIQDLTAIMKSKIILLISLKTFYNISQPLNELRQTQINLIVDAFWYLLVFFYFFCILSSKYLWII